MKQLIVFCLAGLLMACSSDKSINDGQLVPGQLTCEYLENPSVVDHSQPRLSWINVAGKDGYVTVPEKPGVGVELNEEVVKEHLYKGEELFAPTEEWDKRRSWDRQWS